MADQGIRITFLNNATEGDVVSFSGSISGVNIVYNNGLSSINIEFTYNDSEITADPLHKVKIGSTAEETSNNLKSFLDVFGHQSSSIPIYNRVVLGDPVAVWSVESFYTSNSIINFSIDSNNSNVVIVAFQDNPFPVISPKYFFEYINVANDKWRCEIYEKNFSGQVKEIYGRASIEKSEVKNHLEPIRGTGVSLQLEANQDLTFEDLYSKNETDFTVRLYRNNIIMFSGFIRPDGIYQSFVAETWVINVSCVDGLGFLSDLSFVKPNGVPFSGRISMFDIISNCLNRTGLKLKINTFVNVFYYGLPFVTIETDVLKNAYLNTDRFKKSDDNTLMSCQEVLLSILDIFNACVTQDRGEWYIYRPNDFYSNNKPFFKRYEIDNTYIGLNQMVLTNNIGSQIDNYYPHHCSSNQRIEIKGAVSAFRVGYKYGFLGSLLGNGSLFHTAGTIVYEDWEVQTWEQSLINGRLVIDPVSTTGIKFLAATTLGDPRVFRVALKSDVSVILEEGYSFEFKTRIKSYGFTVATRFIVRVGSYYLNWIDGSWEEDALFFVVSNGTPPNGSGTLVDATFERSFTLSTQPLPAGAGGDLEIRMYVPQKSWGGSDVPLVEVKSIELINTFQGNNVVGEFHTVSRINPVSSIVKENKSVSNGDNSNDVYLGAIYQNDLVTLTDNWYRENTTPYEVKPLLRITAEDQLRISQIPTSLFSGNLYGYSPYLALYNIDGINGVFMPISWSFDTYTNISSIKNLQLYSPELYDIEYNKTDDYGETTKPTIIG